MQFKLKWAESFGAVPTNELHWHAGHLIRKRQKNNEINCSRPIDVVQQYADQWFCEDIPMWTNPEDFVPYQGTEDFVSTLRRAGEEGSFFKLPSSVSYQKALATALSTLPTGCSVLIRNEMPPPAWALKDPQEGHSGSRSTEAVTGGKTGWGGSRSTEAAAGGSSGPAQSKGKGQQLAHRLVVCGPVVAERHVGWPSKRVVARASLGRRELGSQWKSVD